MQTKVRTSQIFLRNQRKLKLLWRRENVKFVTLKWPIIFIEISNCCESEKYSVKEVKSSF